ncbi:MAG: dTDP-4-dehydrorhamnose reductase [Nitrospiraceae bacterium]|nr:MAG: dTDP-4-dehydrorhamnose reductase [Nitrospiraceae bacterium]
MKVAVTGSGGMLGQALQEVFSDVDIFALKRSDFDVTDLDKTVASIKRIKPDYLIHAAAYTNVDGCEHDPETAYRVNGIGARNITIACEEIKCPVVFVSTDYVFDGTNDKPYNEWDQTGPVNKYGLSKLLGEQFVTSLTNRFYIVRTSWLYGPHGKNFVDTIARLLSERDKIDVVDDQTGSPTFTYDLAAKLKELIGRGYGTYHISNTSYCSWYEFAMEIAAIKGINGKINPTTSEKYKLPAKRPAYSVLNNTMLRLEGIKELRNWKEALMDYLGQ